MKLNDLDRKNTSIKALKANFDFSFDPSKLNPNQTFMMLNRINKLIKEARSTPDFYKNENEPTYLKLVFISQALTEHYSKVKKARIIVENEEVEKSTVILAMQDMVDSVQKMLEQTNDMLIKELPALVDSIQTEIGVDQSNSFNSSATQSLTNLNTTLSETRKTLNDAMNQVTGQGSPEMLGAPGSGEEMAVTDLAALSGPSGEEVIGQETTAELPDEEPEETPTGPVGREKR